MLINLRNALMAGKRTPTAKNYVQNGLVAMWDGIENAGLGVHDASATVWKDLVGSADINVRQGAFNDDGYDMSKRSYFTFNTDLTTGATVEIVCNITTLANDRNGCFFRIGSSYIQWGRYNTKGIFSIYNGPWTNSQFILPTPYPKIMQVAYIPHANKNAWFDGIAPTRTTEAWTNVDSDNFVGSTQNVGRIRSIRVYSRALTAAEIARNYAIDKARFNLP